MFYLFLASYRNNDKIIVQVWENLEKLGKHLSIGLCSHSISHSPKLQIMSLEILRDTEHVFYFLNKVKQDLESWLSIIFEII